MITTVNSLIRVGISYEIVTIELSIVNRGLPFFEIVGLVSRSIKESKHRVRNAISSIGLEFPRHKAVINMYPADLPKIGTATELAICAAFISSIKGVQYPKGCIFIGEISLEGEVLPISDLFNILYFAKTHGLKNLILPKRNLSQVRYDFGLIKDTNIFAVSNIIELARLGDCRYDQAKIVEYVKNVDCEALNTFDSIVGNTMAKRALEISAAGGHSILFIGPPGVGKSILAKSIVDLLPDLESKEALEVANATSFSTQNDPLLNGLTFEPPFRSPHHTITKSSMIGGAFGFGEIALANKGVLFLDELGEFNREVLDSLRTPLEDRYFIFSKNGKSITYSADFTLICATNPCPCGYHGDPEKGCKCSPSSVSRYIGKFSGPFLDRIDLIVPIHNVDTKSGGHGERQMVRDRVLAARVQQKTRYKNLGISLNSHLSFDKIHDYIKLDSDVYRELEIYAHRYDLNARSIDRVKRIAQTISDLEKSDKIQLKHLLEAISFKKKL